MFQALFIKINIPRTPTINIVQEDTEHQRFKFFLRRTAGNFALITFPETWCRLMPQVSYVEVHVKHAILAFAGFNLAVEAVAKGCLEKAKDAQSFRAEALHENLGADAAVFRKEEPEEYIDRLHYHVFLRMLLGNEQGIRQGVIGIDLLLNSQEKSLERLIMDPKYSLVDSSITSGLLGMQHTF